MDIAILPLCHLSSASGSSYKAEVLEMRVGKEVDNLLWICLQGHLCCDLLNITIYIRGYFCPTLLSRNMKHQLHINKDVRSLDFKQLLLVSPFTLGGT